MTGADLPLRPAGPPPASPALLTDAYELTMVAAALRSGAAARPCAFEVFARHLPSGRRYGVVAGTGRLLELLSRFRFDADQLDYLGESGLVDAVTRDWLAAYRFTGDVDGYAEGEPYFPGSPVLTVSAPFAEAVVLETLVLSVLNHDSAVASAASRMVRAAGTRDCVEFGSRRTHEQAAVAAARAAFVAGFAGTSNLAAGRLYGIPTQGTSAHAFTLVHDDEATAFAAQVAGLGAGTTLLVDTYDTLEGVRHAVAAAGAGLGAVRLDSGDLLDLAVRTRTLLDELGASDTRIFVTSDLDEYAIAALATAPVDAYGVGTALVTGSGAPTAGFVYKLVARGLRPGGPLVGVAKASAGKESVGGRKWGLRRHHNGVAVAEVVLARDEPPPPTVDDRPLTVPLIRAGEVVASTSLAEARTHLRRCLDALPPAAHQLSRGTPAIDTVHAG